MDNDRTIIEKLTDAVKGAANSIVDAASNAAETGIKSNAARMSGRDQQIAGTGNEQIFIPEATDAVAMPIPFTVPRAARKKRKTPAKPAPAKVPNKIHQKKAAARKTTRKARKSAPKKAKSRAGRKAVTKKKPVAKKKTASRSKR